MYEMEMPTVCDCRTVFDLQDGFANNDKTKTICEECYNNNCKRIKLEENIQACNVKIEELEGEVQMCKNEIETAEISLDELPRLI